METTYNRVYGEFLGYPECCIKAFGNQAIPHLLRSPEVKEATFNGFVPCQEHAVALNTYTLTREKLVKQINARRKCTVKFKIRHTQAEQDKISDELWELQ